MGQQDGVAVVPAWVDKLVDELATQYVIVAGPRGAVLLGKIGGRDEDRYIWYRADQMDSTVLGNAWQRITGEHKSAVMQGLRRRAHKRATLASLHPHTTPEGTLVKRDGTWVHTNASGELVVCSTRDAVTYNVRWINKLKCDKRMGLSPSGGDWMRVVGVLADGDPAYPGLQDPLEIIIPCAQGLFRRVIYVVEQATPDGKLTYDVFGFKLERAFTSGKPTLRPYDGPIEPSYYPYPTQKGEKTQWGVLYVPD